MYRVTLDHIPSVFRGTSFNGNFCFFFSVHTDMEPEVERGSISLVGRCGGGIRRNGVRV